MSDRELDMKKLEFMQSWLHGRIQAMQTANYLFTEDDQFNGFTEKYLEAARLTHEMVTFEIGKLARQAER